MQYSLKLNYEIKVGSLKSDGRRDCKFVIIYQDNLIREGLLWTAANGWKIGSSVCPQISVGDMRVIYLKGASDLNSCGFIASDKDLAEIEEAIEDFIKNYLKPRVSKPHKLTTIFQ